MSCSICLLSLSLNNSIKKCEHCDKEFHRKCLNRWLISNDTCPLCRQILDRVDPYISIINKEIKRILIVCCYISCSVICICILLLLLYIMINIHSIRRIKTNDTTSYTSYIDK